VKNFLSWLVKKNSYPAWLVKKFLILTGEKNSYPGW
jgi:hypothetical protein